MTTLADIVAAHGGAYLAEFGAKLLPSHRRALTDITACRTELMGGHISQCEACGHQQYLYHSCKNRSCPKCHGVETGVWLEKREAELLPVRYFHLVFTLPAELRDLVRRNQKSMSDGRDVLEFLELLMRSVINVNYYSRSTTIKIPVLWKSVEIWGQACKVAISDPWGDTGTPLNPAYLLEL